MLYHLQKVINFSCTSLFQIVFQAEKNDFCTLYVIAASEHDKTTWLEEIRQCEFTSWISDFSDQMTVHFASPSQNVLTS